MKKYKSRADIRYIDFERFNDAIDGRDDDAEYIAEMVMLIFYPKVDLIHTAKCLTEFNKAFNTEGNIQNYRIDLKFKKAFKFIDADTFIKDAPIDFLSIVLKSWIPFKEIDVNKVSLSTAQNAFKLFTNELPK
jgi:hypothetical protein